MPAEPEPAPSQPSGRATAIGASPSDLDAAPGPLIVVSVGTDHHPFDRLVSWMDAWAGEHPPVSVVIQQGSSRPAERAEGHPLIAHQQLCQLFAAATVVVCHGGPSTVMDARAAGRLPIVLCRDPALGEHIDDHQLRFGTHLARYRLAEVVHDRDQLEATVAAALADPGRYRVAVDTSTVPGVVAFGRVADALIGTRTPLAPPRVGEGAMPGAEHARSEHARSELSPS
jgi:UDP-N-acetylglucosamine transferase subunit ALG13